MSTAKRIISLLLAVVMTVGMLPPTIVRASEVEVVEEAAAVEASEPAQTTEDSETTAVETEAPETIAAPEETAAPETALAEETVITLPPVSREAALASSGTCGDNLTWTLSNDGVLTISGTGAMADYTAPSYVPWYSSKDTITTVIIEDGVTTIGNAVFYECTKLTDLTIGKDVTSIGFRSFRGCTGLKNVTIPGSVTTIGKNAFYGCTGLRALYIPANVVSIPATSVADSPFYGCYSGLNLFCEAASKSGGWGSYWYAYKEGYYLKVCWAIPEEDRLFWTVDAQKAEVTIPDSITTIPDNAFYQNVTMTSITIPATVTSIGSNAFDYCSGLTTVNISDLAAWCSISFENWTANPVYYAKTLKLNGTIVKDLVIPEGVTSIGNYAFYYGAGFISAEIPDSVSTIGNYAFKKCTGMSEVTVGSGVTSIGSNAFENCTGLAKIRFRGDAPSIASSAFSGITATALYPAGNSTWTSDVLKNYGGTITWEEACTAGHTPVVIPAVSATCTKTGLTAGSRCSVCGVVLTAQEVIPMGNHTAVTVPAVEATCTETGLTEGEKCSVCGKILTAQKVVPILDHTALTIPAVEPTCTETGLTEGQKCSVCGKILTAQEEVPAKHSVSNTVCDCGYGFGTCGENLTWILENGLLTVSGTGPMDDYSYQTGAPWVEGIASITSVVIEEGVTTVGASAFGTVSRTDVGNYRSLTSVTLPESLTGIGASAFEKCVGLTSIAIPENTVSIGQSAFMGTALVNVTLPQGLQEIQGWTFMNCTALTSVEIPDSVRVIAPAAFTGCSRLPEVMIPAGVASVSEQAFAKCTGLKKIWFKGNVPSFGEDAFRGVTANVYYPAGDATWTADMQQNYGGQLTWKSWCAQGHDYEHVVTEPDCENGGYTTHTCIYCGHSYTDSETAALGHDFGDWTVTNAVTCTVDGLERRDCSRCDHYETNVLTAPGHTEQILPAKDATCTESGLTEGTSCSVCQEVLLAQQTVDALGHAYENHFCPRCGEYAAGSGTIGGDQIWAVDTETGELTITGTGTLDIPEETPWAGYADTVTDIVIGEGITSIGGGIFDGLENLESVTIPGSVETIDPDAFSGCDKLTDIFVSDENANYMDQDGILFSKDGTELIRYPGGRKDKAYTVPETVTKIHDNAFSGDADLEAIYFTGNMPEFGDNAFQGLEATVYYPGGDPTWEKDRLLDYGGSILWVPVYDQPEVISIKADKHTLLRDQKAVLTALLNFGEDEILWSLAEGDETYADLTFQGTGAVLTAKSVEQKQTVTVTARTAGGMTSAQVQLEILPQVTAVQILDELERQVGGTTVLYDLNAGKTKMVFSAAVLPAGAPAEVSWETNDPDGAYAAYTVAGSTITIKPTGEFGSVTLTATATDGSGCADKVTVRFTALEMEKDERSDADLDLLSGGKKTLKVYDAETGKALTSKQITWSLDPVYEPYAAITKDGKLTAKKVVKQVRIEAVGTITSSESTQVVVTVDIFPAVTQVQVWDGNVLANGKTIPFNLSRYASKLLTVRLFPEDVMDVPVKWTISDSKNQYAKYEVDEQNNTLTIHTPTNKQGTVTLKAMTQDGSKKTVTVKVKFCILADSVTIGVKDAAQHLESWELDSGKSVQLQAAVASSVMGVNPTDTKVTWSLVDPADKSYVSLSSSGKVTAKDVSVSRDVWIKATARDGSGKDDTFLVTVQPKNRGILTLVSEGKNVTKSTILVDLNKDDRNVVLSAHTFGAEEMEDVTWSPTTSKIANIEPQEDGKLKVQMVSAGSLTVKAAAKDGRTATVTIKAVRLAADVTLSQKKTGITEGLELASGKSLDLQAVVTGTTSQKVTWSIAEGGEYATVSASGRVTAARDLTRAHSVTVQAAAADGSAAKKSLTLTVRPLAQGVQVYTIENGIRTFSARTSSWWVRSNTNLKWDLANQSDIIRLNADVFPFYGVNDDGKQDDRNAIQKVTWKSSSTKIADFLKDQDGNLILDEGNVQLQVKGTGTATITATAADGSNQKVSFQLIVVRNVNDFTLEPQVLASGKSLNLAKLVKKNPEPTTTKKFGWAITRGAAYATISSGGSLKAKTITAHRQVEVTVTALDSKGYSESFTIDLYPSTTKVLLFRGDSDVTGKTLTLASGELLRLSVSTQPAAAAGKYTWKSSNTKLVTVDETTGEIRVIGTSGTATITCSTLDGSGKKATVKIKIG